MNDFSGDIVRMQEQIASMKQSLRPLMSGHPLLFLQNITDVDAFDPVTGRGSGIWAEWAAANGSSYTASDGSTITTYDMRDRTAVGSGTTYTVGQQFGAATHTLTVDEIPVINPSVTDPGHTHTHTDPGHTHVVTDPGHTHTATQGAHTHTGTTSTDGDHKHYPVSNAGNTWCTSDNSAAIDVGDGTDAIISDNDDMTTEGDHTHTLVIDSATPVIAVAAANTGVSNNSNTTGITNNSNTTGITVASFGGGDPHNNLQPSCAGLWVQRIG